MVSQLWQNLGFIHSLTIVALTCLCPKSLRMVASFFVLAYWRWATMAGFGSLQSTERRWSHISACCRWGCFRLGSKQWTSHPDLARKCSRDRSSTPNLWPTQDKIIRLSRKDEPGNWTSILSYKPKYAHSTGCQKLLGTVSWFWLSVQISNLVNLFLHQLVPDLNPNFAV